MENLEKNSRSRGWCYTVNNYTDDDIAYAMSLFEEDEGATYQIIGFEKAPRTGTLHLQCYIYYTNQQQFNTMFKRLSPWHFEPQKTYKNVNAYCYCMEDGDYFEQGQVPRQGHRTDLEVIKHRIKEGVPLKQISNQYFSQWVFHKRAFEEFRNMNLEYDTELWFYDPDSLDSMRRVREKKNECDYLLMSQYEMSPTQLVFMYLSKKYRYIYYPNHNYVPEVISKIIKGTLY